MGQSLTFILNGETVVAAEVAPFEMLMNWLRYQRRLTGTKEGCAEGDCGACTVVIREIGLRGELVARAANACITLMAMLHGKEVVTIEHLSADGAPHPVQTALAEAHGAQCGFCTPGIVMSLWRAHQAGAPADAASVKDQLAGNLCRCTGYGPILAAAETARAVPPNAAEDEAALARLKALDLAPLDHETAEGRAWAPRKADDLAALIAAEPEARILSGATDIGLWVTKNGYRPEKLIYLGDCPALRLTVKVDGGLRFHAGVSNEDAMRILGGHYPDMGELFRRFASVQVRASGTLCGNIANGSPIGDAAPALIAAGARLTLRQGAKSREIELEDFFIAYGEQDLRPGEFVESVYVPTPADPLDLRCYKISKRFDQDISAVLAAINLEMTDGVVSRARIAFGGMSATPKRAKAAEGELLGKPFDDATVAAAIRALDQDFAPISDHRASAEYRMTVARNLLLKYFVERGFGDQRVAGRACAIAAE